MERVSRTRLRGQRRSGRPAWIRWRIPLGITVWLRTKGEGVAGRGIGGWPPEEPLPQEMHSGPAK